MSWKSTTALAIFSFLVTATWIAVEVQWISQRPSVFNNALPEAEMHSAGGRPNCGALCVFEILRISELEMYATVSSIPRRTDKGTSLAELQRALETCGIKVALMRCDEQQLKLNLKRRNVAAVLHLNSNHYLVIHFGVHGVLTIYDPLGPASVNEILDHEWSGYVAICHW